MFNYQYFLKLCREADIRPTKLGEKIKVNGEPLRKSAISSWSRGVTPRPITVKALSDYFKVPVDYFYIDDEEPKTKPATNCEQCPCHDHCDCHLTEYEKELIKMYRAVPLIDQIRMLKEVTQIWEMHQK